MRGGSRVFSGAIAVALAFTPATQAHALDPKRLPSQWMHDTWSEAEGLPQNSVRAVAQTPDGFLWIGTEEGLVRFDGTRFSLFDRKATQGRTTNLVMSLGVSEDGHLLVLTGHEGLCTFDEPVFTCSPLPLAATGSALRSFDGVVYVTSDRGLFASRGSRDGALERIEAFGTGTIRDVAVNRGVLYGIDASRGLVAVSAAEIDRREPAARTIPLPSGVAKDDLTTLTAAHDGTIWVGTARGPFVLQGDRLEPAPGDGRPTGNVRFVAEDAVHQIFVSINDDGLYRVAAGRFERIEAGAAQPAERFVAFLEDDEHDVWLGSLLSGLHRLRDGAFVPWGKPEGVEHGYVGSVLATPDGTVWLATAGGAYAIQGSRVVHFGTAEGLPRDGVLGLATDGEGRVLVGTRSGLARIASTSPPRAEHILGVRDRELVVVLSEPRGLVFGTPKGLFDQVTGRTYTTSDGMPGDFVTALARDRDGSLFIGTMGGLARLAKDAERPFVVSPRNTIIPALLSRPDGSVFVGTSDSGLHRLRGDEDKALRRDAGLYDDTVFALLDDGAGFLWMTCNLGIYRVAWTEIDAYFEGRIARVTSRAFGRSDGMRSRECNAAAPGAARDASGRLWFPTMLGAVSVDPRAIDDGPPPRAPIIESARFGKALERRPGRVVLPADARSLDVSVAVPALSAPERVAIEVRLVGEAAVSSAFHEAPGRVASFEGLPPGTYRFEARARDTLGRTSPGLAALVIEVPPRLVERTSFRIAMGAFGFALVTALGMLRLRSVEASRRRLAELVEERTAELKRAETDLVRAEKMASVATLVRGIAHELNNPLGFVTGNLAPLRKYAEFLLGAIRDVAAGKTSIDAVRMSPTKDLAFVERDLRALLTDIEEGGRRARLIVRDLQGLTSATSRALEPVDLAKVADGTVRLLTPQKPEGVALALDAEPTEPIFARAGELEQATVNLVDNALRAVGPGGNVRVVVRTEGDARVVVVEDDGAGMSEEVRQRATEPFFTTRAAGEGSGLGLAIVASIAEHHRGSLDIESAPGEGTRVRLTVRDAT